MKKIDSIRKIAEAFISKRVMTQEHSKLILKAQASLKEHVLNGDCTYCGKKVDRELFKNESEKYDYFLFRVSSENQKVSLKTLIPVNSNVWNRRIT